jgi:hypothetical protein
MDVERRPWQYGTLLRGPNIAKSEDKKTQHSNSALCEEKRQVSTFGENEVDLRCGGVGGGEKAGPKRVGSNK